MLKYVSQFFLQIFPSVIATVVGAYIVNHYIIPKAGSDAPKAAAYSKAAPGASDDQGAIDVTPKSETAKSETAKSEASAAPDSKPDAKGKAVEKPVEAAKADTKASADAKRPAPREKAAVRMVLPPTNETATASIAPAAPAQTDERRDRDANELARAAIERLRNSGEATRPAEPQHALEPVREPVREAVREAPLPASREPVRMNVVAVPPAVQPRTAAVQPLPPPVTVMAPSVEASVGDVPQAPPLYVPPPRRMVDANRLIPPADIPAARPPIDLQPASTRTSVADDVLSAARSVIHTIVPQ
ncbi:cell envelope biogenesis protein TolA [Bradyrhizobium prioriisuperbiae]|uniref:cell envelope biogenesis protein TolA n=1 Tax=Bradyrhizobium prioriisuperbiae TaxID=2854389 RepID=UPI0028EC4F4A|nr:cell envelope biogenesis protein TolA [Bradyrhizobium prioritasuperba]